MDSAALARLREFALALPGVEEGITVHHPSFKVRGKAFVMCADADGPMSLWVKSTIDEQQALISSDAHRFFKPPYVGPKGWVGMRLHEPLDWIEVAELVEDGFRLVASKRQLAELDRR